MVWILLSYKNDDSFNEYLCHLLNSMKTSKWIWLIFLLAYGHSATSQEFDRRDSLRGSITDERIWWDLLHYDIRVAVNIENKSISGDNKIRYKVLSPNQVMQIDLQDPMKVTSIRQNGEFLVYKKEQGAYFVKLRQVQEKGAVNEITVSFEGIPPESTNAPWDGGFVWQKDRNQNPFVANANQLLGSSSWLPTKDIPYDEPDEGMKIRITTPSGLVSVSNGRLIEENPNKDGTDSYTWQVVNPINGYGINMNIGNYAHFKDTYQGEKGPLDLDYYVLTYNLKKAKEHFKQVPKMLEALEYWFGPYPFYEDGYKLVEAPYLGMEHQSSVTYGNGFQNGYLGGDLSNTGMGLKFDFIIVHESGHEWFANSLTNYDVADMWIHEGFTTYSEVLYLDYHFGTEAGNTYLKGYRNRTMNDVPIIGAYEVNHRGSGDMYIKGAAMIHTLRQVINDDAKFRELLRNINHNFFHRTLSSEQLENFIIKETGLDLSGFFDQYLRTTKIPLVQYQVKNGIVKYRYRNTVSHFNIPVRFYMGEEEIFLKPTPEWQEFQLPSKESTLRIDDNYYIYFQPK